MIKPAQTEMAGPIFFLPKKERSLYFCAKYRKLSPVTVRDTYVLSRTDECIDPWGDIIVFSSVNTSSGNIAKQSLRN